MHRMFPRRRLVCLWFWIVPTVCVTVRALDPLDAARAGIGEKRMARADYCTGQVLAAAHRNQSAHVRSLLECVTLCAVDATCRAIVFDPNGKWCHLGDATANGDCSNMEPSSDKLTHYQIVDVTTQVSTMQPLVCGVNQVLQEGTCVCARGYRGDPCSPYTGDCQDLMASGVTADGAYDIHPLLATEPFTIYCSFKDHARNYIMDRHNSKLRFDLPWASYRDGFGALTGDHWLGLQKIHLLTSSRPYSLRVTIKLKNSSALYQECDNFVVSDEASNFRLSVGTCLPTDNLGDCLQPLSDSAFSTCDRDNDGDDAVSCAAKHAGGWWFRGSMCSTCNPTGPLSQPASGLRLGVDNEAFWTDALGDLAPYKITFYLQAM